MIDCPLILHETLSLSSFFAMVHIMKHESQSMNHEELLARNVEGILPSSEALRKKLAQGKPLRVKHGIDPTGPAIHIGRAVVLWKLREFQEAGHKIVLIFGDFTARIGDPSDKDKRRPVVTKEQIDANVKGYVEQIGKILDMADVELHYNSEWHALRSQADLIALSRLLTVNQMLARRNFAQRFKEQKEIGIDEFLYPLLQGYDSVAIKSDVELGGTDQLFNLEAGRIIQQALGQEPQFIMTTSMLLGLDGRKMSTSWGNMVTIIDEPSDMFGKLMALRDELTTNYLQLTTRLSEEEIKQIGEIQNPKEQKECLAFEVVKLYHGVSAAKKAQEEFTSVFSQKQLPSEIQEVKLPQGNYSIIELLVKTNLASSKSEARRLINQKGVRIDECTVESVDETISLNDSLLIEKGRRHVVRLVASNN